MSKRTSLSDSTSKHIGCLIRAEILVFLREDPLLGLRLGVAVAVNESHDGSITSEHRSSKERQFNMAGLPEGLVTNSESITGKIDSVDHVDVEDIITLWKGPIKLRCCH